MIIVEGWVRLEEGELERLHDVAVTMLDETRKEEGCISYCFSRAIEDPNTMRIAEVWQDQDALDAHMKSPHMATFNQALGGAKILGASVKAYPADEVKTLMGAD